MTYFTRIKQIIGSLIIFVMLMIGGVVSIPVIFVLPDWSEGIIPTEETIGAILFSAILATVFTYIIFVVLNKLIFTKDKFNRTREYFFAYSFVTLFMTLFCFLTDSAYILVNWHAGGFVLAQEVFPISFLPLFCLNVLSLIFIYFLIGKTLKDKE